MIKKFKIDGTSMGSMYDPICKIEDKESAKAYLEALVWFRLNEQNDKRAYDAILEAERKNIGYYAGYFSSDISVRIYDLFDTAHPYFGRRTDMTVEELVKMGMAAASKL